jgi:hypothetical protein
MMLLVVGASALYVSNESCLGLHNNNKKLQAARFTKSDCVELTYVALISKRVAHVQITYE